MAVDNKIMAIFITKNNSIDEYDLKMRDSSGNSYYLKISDINVSLDRNTKDELIQDKFGRTTITFRREDAIDLRIQAKVR